jgi:hypothetical protein
MSASVPVLAAIREARARPQSTIQCPCCGADTGVPTVLDERTRHTPAQWALRERMHRAGLSWKAVKFWTTRAR